MHSHAAIVPAELCVSTADETVFGRIAKLSSQPWKGLTTLHKEILSFILIIVSLEVFFVS